MVLRITAERVDAEHDRSFAAESLGVAVQSKPSLGVMVIGDSDGEPS